MHLTVIAKLPEPGRVKTRLCPPCTPEQAAEIAAAALADTMDAVDTTAADPPAFAQHGATHVRRVVLLEGRRGGWTRDGYDVVAQRGDGLGERLANGFDDLGPGVIVGMDTPSACRWLGAALAAVAEGRDVIGLASDGGYWVIGLAAPDARVFQSVPMSQSNTGLAQLRRLHDLGRPVRLLPMARDLDDIADLRAHARSGGPGRLAATARAIIDRLD